MASTAWTALNKLAPSAQRWIGLSLRANASSATRWVSFVSSLLDGALTVGSGGGAAANAGNVAFSELVPADGYDGYSRTGNVSFLVQEPTAGMQSSSVNCDVDGYHALVDGNFNAPFATSSTIVAEGSGYRVVLVRDTNYAYSSEVTADAYAFNRDGVRTDQSWTWTVEDSPIVTSAPLLSNRSPANGATGVSNTKIVSYHVTDPDAGEFVQQDTLDAYVDGTPVMIAGVAQSGWSVEISAITDGYSVAIAKDTPWLQADVVTMRIVARNGQGDVLDDSANWTFTIEDEANFLINFEGGPYAMDFRLSGSVTASGDPEDPDGAWIGDDADTSGWTAYDGYGLDLDTVVSTTSLRSDSPLVSSVYWCAGQEFDGAEYYRTSSTSFLNLSTNDVVVEAYFRVPWDLAGQDHPILEKRAASSPFAGWRLTLLSTGKLQFLLDPGAAASVSMSSSALTAGAWYHVILFVNRSLNQSYGGRMYINGVYDAQANFSAVGSVDNTRGFAMGQSEASGDLRADGLVLEQAAVWHGSGMLADGDQTAAWAAEAESRYQRIIGIHPDKHPGTGPATVYDRSSSAYSDKVIAVNGTRKLFLRDSDDIRTVWRKAADGGDIRGVLPEKAITNLMRYSEQLDKSVTGVGWSYDVTAVTIDANQDTSPDGQQHADRIVEKAGSAQFGVEQALDGAMLPSTTYCGSVWVIAKNKSRVRLNLQSGGFSQALTNHYATFDLSSQTVVDSSNIIDAGIEGPFLGGSYRCWVVATTSSVTEQSFRIHPVVGTSITYTGVTNVIALALWGAQVETGDGPTTYVKTGAGTASRSADDLRYNGDNLGSDTTDGKAKVTFLIPDLTLASARNLFTIDDGGASTDKIQARVTASTGRGNVYVDSAEGSAESINGPAGDLADDDIHTLQIDYQANSATVSVDDVDGTENTDAVPPDDCDTIRVGMGSTNAGHIDGVIGKVEIWQNPDGG